MATNTFTSNSAVGNREDLSDYISVVAREESPFYSSIGKSKATATFHEWQTDALAEPKANAQVEGFVAENEELTATTRLGNYTQIFSGTVSTSKTQDVVMKAGRKEEITYQVDKKMREIMRDIELALVGNQTPSAGSAGSARYLRPLEGWYATNTSRGSGGANGSSTAAATDGTARSLTQSLVDDVLQNIYESGGGKGSSLMMMVAPKQKKNVSAFVNTSSTSGYEKTRFTSIDDSKVYQNTFDIYESDFGNVKVMINPQMKNTNSLLNRERTLHIIDPQYFAVASLRPMTSEVLAKRGDSEERLLTCELTLESKNERASGVVADLS